MSDKYVIYDSDTGDIVYMGGKPSEPLTPKKQALIDSGWELKRVRTTPRRDLSGDLAFLQIKNGKLKKKTIPEINAIIAEREQAEVDAAPVKAVVAPLNAPVSAADGAGASGTITSVLGSKNPIIVSPRLPTQPLAF